MKFFIKEIKTLTRRNALDKPLYESKYAICRTRVWGRLARLLPFFFTEEMKFDIARISKDLHRDICFNVTWQPCGGGTRIYSRFLAEDILGMLQSHPDHFYTEVGLEGEQE